MYDWWMAMIPRTKFSFSLFVHVVIVFSVRVREHSARLRNAACSFINYETISFHLFCMCSMVGPEQLIARRHKTKWIVCSAHSVPFLVLKSQKGALLMTLISFKWNSDNKIDFSYKQNFCTFACIWQCEPSTDTRHASGLFWKVWGYSTL